jgi:hypothetical protein
MVIGEATAVVTTLKNASDLADRIRKSDDKETLRAGASQLTEMLFNARAAALDLVQEKAELVDRVRQLELQLRDASDFLADGKYERMQTPQGQFVFCERGKGGPPFFCPTCFGNRKASILLGRQSDTFHLCHVCRWNAHL